MRRWATMLAPLALFAGLALAGGNGVGWGGLSGQGLPSWAVTTDQFSYAVQATPFDGGAAIYYVDGRGSDANACLTDFATSGTAGPCLTPQAAINKVPKFLRQKTTVSIDGGAYPGFIVSGFTSDVGNTTSAGLLVDGTLVTSTLATGSATGTATAGTAGTGATFGTLTDGAATWTVNDLRGRFIITATPTNVIIPISSNTATVITVEGLWSAPTGSTTYTILDPGVTINTAVSRPSSATNATSANLAAIFITDNSIGYRLNGLTLQNLRLTNSSGAGAYVQDNSAPTLMQMQIRSSGAAVNGVVVNGQTPVAPNAAVSMAVMSIQLTTSAAAVQVNGGYFSMSNSLVINTGSSSVNPAVQLGTFAAGIVRLNVISNSELTNFFHGVVLQNGSSTGVPGTPGISHVRVSCLNSSGTGFVVGNPDTTTVGGSGQLAGIANSDVSTCGTGVQVVGYSQADVLSLSGSVGTTGFSSFLGGLIDFSKSGTTFTAGTNEVNLDSGGVTSAFTDIAALSCLSDAVTGSRVCGR